MDWAAPRFERIRRLTKGEEHMTLIEAAKLTLEALGNTHTQPGCEQWLAERKASVILNQAIAESERAEPVAWVREHELPLAPGDAFSWVETLVHKTPLYTTPPAAQPAERKAGCTLCGYCAATGERVVKADTRNGLIDNDFEENT